MHDYGANQGLFFWLLYMIMELARVCFLVIMKQAWVCFLVIIHDYGASQGLFFGYYT